MLDDYHISKEQLNSLDAASKYFTNFPSPECIQLFLGCFGWTDGFGVYQALKYPLLKFTLDEILPHLLRNLKSSNPNISYWNLEMAGHFLSSENPNNQLREAISALPYDPESYIRDFVSVVLE